MTNEQTAEARMNPDELWREETYTDRVVGLIRRYVPVKPDGSPDSSRQSEFYGEASLMTPAGTLPIHFKIEAADLPAAVAAYGAALQKGLQETMEELKELRRKASSQIVLPQGGLGGLAGPGGGLPPAPGKLKL